MKLFRHLDLMIAVFWCAAMLIVPLAAAADAGQGTNQGNNQGMNQPGSLDMDPGQGARGNNQMQQDMRQGTGSGNTMNQQGNGQNNAVPGQGSRPGGSWNMTLHNGPQGRVPGNATTFGNQTSFKPDDSNLTAPPEKPAWNPANMTAANQTWHGHGDGNLTLPAEPPGQGNTTGQQGQHQILDQQSAQDQMNSTGELLTQLIAWLKAHIGS